MSLSFSQVYSATYLGLGQPTDDILSKLELANIVQRRWSYRMEGVRQSEQSVILAESSEFTLGADEDEKDLTTLESDFAVPMWMERQTISYLNHPVWEFVPTVNLNILQQFRASWMPAVAFHGSNPTECIAKFSYFGNETWLQQTRIHRVWYLPNMTEPTTETTDVQLPDNLVNILIYDTYVSAIPLMQMNMAKQLKDKPELKDQMDALRGLYAQYSIEQQEFQKLFDKWANESRGSHRPRKRNDVLSSRGGYKTTYYNR